MASSKRFFFALTVRNEKQWAFMAFRKAMLSKVASRSSASGSRSMSSWWGSVEPAAKDPILGVTEAFLADTSPDKVNVGVVSLILLLTVDFYFFYFFIILLVA